MDPHVAIETGKGCVFGYLYNDLEWGQAAAERAERKLRRESERIAQIVLSESLRLQQSGMRALEADEVATAAGKAEAKEAVEAALRQGLISRSRKPKPSSI